MTVTSVGGEDLVGFAQRVASADRDGFLADRRMSAAGEKALAIAFDSVLLKKADRPHLAVPFQQRFKIGCFHSDYFMTSRQALTTSTAEGKTRSCNLPVGMGKSFEATRMIGAWRKSNAPSIAVWAISAP